MADMFAPFSLADAVAPGMQARQLRLQEAQVEGTLAKLAREQQMQANRQQVLSSIGADTDFGEVERTLLRSGDVEGAAEVGRIGEAAFKRQAEQENRRMEAAQKWMGVLQKSPQLLENPEFRKFLAGPGGIGEPWALELTPAALEDADGALKRRKLLAETLVAERTAKLGPDAKTELGKLNQDFASGNISRRDYDAKRKTLFGPDSEKLFTNAAKLRGEFDKQSADFMVVRDAYETILASAEDPSPAGDLSLIFSYMKALDPGSTVREGEQALARNAAGVPDRIRNIYNSILTGETLAADQRRDFVDRARRLYETRLRTQDDLTERYTGLADTYGIPPDQVVRDLRVKRAPMAPEGVRPAEGREMPTPKAATAAERQNRFLGMGTAELAKVDMTKLSDAELDAYIDALTADQRAIDGN